MVKQEISGKTYLICSNVQISKKLQKAYLSSILYSCAASPMLCASFELFLLIKNTSSTYTLIIRHFSLKQQTKDYISDYIEFVMIGLNE
ncbi:hypothetical protein T4D_6736 [Trichinella pseudospiralis]|uniref:Uncharacterized protein n=1 Tax=Trichinella pseudospiralis TaxID=6337 RepID=A0A0V1G3E9_TRIPS|nr:hypothetical protein T4D_6736 [Trichinella pseudospiralis]